MTISTINASEEHSQRIGQVYQEHYAKLLHYFLTLLGNASEADKYAQETIRRFFFFMEDRCWETDVEYIPVYLMRIAGFLCSRRLAEKRVRRSHSRSDKERNSLFNKIKAQAIQTISDLAEFRQLFLRPIEGSIDSKGF